MPASMAARRLTQGCWPMTEFILRFQRILMPGRDRTTEDRWGLAPWTRQRNAPPQDPPKATPLRQCSLIVRVVSAV
jgi:hypothetical protein